MEMSPTYGLDPTERKAHCEGYLELKLKYKVKCEAKSIMHLKDN
jgi:hypothetical protein